MTRQVYPNANDTRKQASALINFDVIASGSVFHHADIISASIVAHETGGRLYRVLPMADTPNGFKRYRIEPLSLDVAKRCSNRTPKKRDLGKLRIPVWR